MSHIALLAVALLIAAPRLDPQVAERAATAFTCSTETGPSAKRLLIADMSRPSSEQRFWAFDVSDPRHPHVILRTRVAHGSGSDPANTGVPTTFSNIVDSGMTSLGLYRIAEAYVSDDGRPAFSLDGLDPTNDNARSRHVVLHPAQSSFVGRSLGCPSIDPAAFEKLSKERLSGSLLWIDGPDPSIASERSLQCAVPQKLAAK
jgi:hypothetical protein